MPESSGPFLPVARLLRAQGRRGELLAEPLSDLPGLFTAGACFRTEGSGSSKPSRWILEDAWYPTGRNAGRVVLKLASVDSISAAEAVAGQDLLLAESALPARDPDTFFVRDLLGCTLFDGEAPVGEIVDVQFATAPDGRTRLEDAAPLLAVQPLPCASASPPESLPVEAGDSAAAEPFLVPFVKAWIEQVDVASRSIRMKLPGGLINSSEARDHGRP